jgi:hypothetical protein
MLSKKSSALAGKQMPVRTVTGVAVYYRDSVLDVGERGDRVMLCVSRARVAVTLDM